MYRQGPPQKQETITIPALSPDQLFDRRRERDATKLKSYNRILEAIYKRIQTVSKNQEMTWINFNIPVHMISFNVDELEDCITYVVHMLRQQGYEVRYTFPNLLYVSWAKYERDYLLKENPIIQAMTPPEPTKGKRTAPASQLGPRIQRPTNQPSYAPKVQFAPDVAVYGLPPVYGGSAGSQPIVAPPRPAAAYKPPASFMNAVERPLPENKSAMDAFLGF
jgi:hypothetical protein